MGGVAAVYLAIPEALILGAIAQGAGRKVCRRLLPDSSSLEQAVFGFPAGMALLSVFTTALLFARVPPLGLRVALGAVLAAAAAWSGSEIALSLRELRDFARESPALAALIAGAALVGLVGCLAPETGWDTGVYHFAMARARAEQGAMIVRLDTPQWYRPAYLESLHSVGFALSGETLASLINEAYYFAGLAVARLWGFRLAGPSGGRFAALAWFTSITYLLRMNGGDVEVALAVYLGIAYLSLLRLRDGASTRWRVLAGGALGMLLGMKYTSCYLVLVLAVVWAVVRVLDRAPLRALVADGLLIGLLGLLVACPWYVRNRLTVGGFIYPFQGTEPTMWLGGGRTGAGVPGEGAGTQALRSIAMDAFVLAGVAAMLLPGFSRDRWTGIVAILLTPWLVRRMGWTEQGVGNALRYASPGWISLIVLGAAGVARAVESRGVRAWLALGVLFTAAGVGLAALLVRNTPKLPVALGLASREDYLASRVSTYRAIREAEAGLPAGKRILLVEERVYYCRAPFLAAPDPQQAIDFRRMSSAGDLGRFLKEESIGAIVVDRTPEARTWHFRELEGRLGPDWPIPGVRAVTIAGKASLYRVD